MYKQCKRGTVRVSVGNAPLSLSTAAEEGETAHFTRRSAQSTNRVAREVWQPCNHSPYRHYYALMTLLARSKYRGAWSSFFQRIRCSPNGRLVDRILRVIFDRARATHRRRVRCMSVRLRDPAERCGRNFRSSYCINESFVLLLSWVLSCKLCR